jgi:hypothetical protein
MANGFVGVWIVSVARALLNGEYVERFQGNIKGNAWIMLL